MQMKNGKNRPATESFPKKNPKLPPIPPAMVTAPKDIQHANTRRTVDPRWAVHISIRKEP